MIKMYKAESMDMYVLVILYMCHFVITVIHFLVESTLHSEVFDQCVYIGEESDYNYHVAYYSSQACVQFVLKPLLSTAGMLQLRLPKQQVQQTTNAEPAGHSDATSVCSDRMSMAESEDGAHPLAPTHSLCNQVSLANEERGSLQSLYHGQDFSHMFIEPTFINVQLEDEDEKGIEVTFNLNWSSIRMYHNILEF